jgi:hypothetical protein
MYEVAIDGVLQEPTVAYAIDADANTITFTSAPPTGSNIVVVQRGYAIPVTTGTVSTSQIETSAVTDNELATNAVTAIKIQNGAVTADKLDSSAKDRSIFTGTQAASTISDFDTEVSNNTSVAANTAKVGLTDNSVTAARISDTDTQFLVDDTSAQKAVVINEGGADVDFRVEGDTDANLIVTDGDNNVVGIGGTDSSYKFNVDGGTSAGIANLTSNVAAGSVALFIRNSSATGISSAIQLVGQTGGTSYSKSLNLDLASGSNYFQISHNDGDLIGVRLLNSNGGIGSETGAFYPSFDSKTSSGAAGNRWSVVYSATGAINTSDRNAKKEIEDLSEAELRVATAIKGLVKKFKFKGRVRKHVGVIAQDVQDAFTAEGLDASEYGLFCSDTWTDEETGEEKTRLGIRYEELLAFVIAAL